MQQAGAPGKVIRVPGGGHDFAASESNPEWPDVFWGLFDGWMTI